MKYLALFSTLLLGACATAPAPTAPAGPAPVRHEGQRIVFDPASPQLARFRTAKAEEAEIPATALVAPGRIELNPGKVSRVLLPVAGRVREVMVALGDPVKAGQTVLTLESPEVGAVLSALRQAEAARRQAEAGRAKAMADLSRAKDLFANRAIAQKEVLAAETLLQQAQADVEVAEASRDEALRRLELLGLRPGTMQQLIAVPAPVSGKVLEVMVTPGEFRSDPASPTLTIADLSTVWIAADVPEDQMRAVVIGAPLEVEMAAYPDRTFRARVLRMADALDPQTRTVKVRAELPNGEGLLRPEMFGTVRSASGTRRAVVVPRSAIYQQQGRTTVFRTSEKGVYEELAVELIYQDRDRAAVRGPLAAGDAVVIDGVTQLRAY
jgi:cobalt-zinc-cadmium efflux system membrane fusion protein